LRYAAHQNQEGSDACCESVLQTLLIMSAAEYTLCKVGGVLLRMLFNAL